ncbi:uncharacterized protein YALI1_E10140g [Yarrowia lipolytica]|uniref:Uncharacterized protein n=1 Tax=Yarrowia lipolytica TaxID=4952 RepID=A0A1D8NHL2_YARLL|nr:hypothetical protein YALI1_E10140g [Yarrowia lipolytica]
MHLYNGVRKSLTSDKDQACCYSGRSLTSEPWTTLVCSHVPLSKRNYLPRVQYPCLAQLVFDNLIRLKTPENSPFVAEHFPEVTH